MEFSCNIQNLKTHAIVGLFSWERLKPQPLVFDLTYSYSAPEKTLTDTELEVPDYTEVADTLIQFVKAQKFQILEAMLFQSVEHLKHHFPALLEIQINVLKPAAIPQSSGPKLFFQKKFK